MYYTWTITADGGEKRRFVIEPHSPYYIHFEGPGLMIGAMVFDRKNYDLWERVIRMALKAKNKLGFVDGTLTRLKAKVNEEFLDLDTREMVDSILCSWLLNVIYPSLRMNMLTRTQCRSCGRTWRNAMLWPANTLKVHQLKANITNLQTRRLGRWSFLFQT